MVSIAVPFQGEQYLQLQEQLMMQPAVMNSSSAVLSLSAAFACTGTVAVRVAGTGVLSALALGGASATCSYRAV